MRKKLRRREETKLQRIWGVLSRVQKPLIKEGKGLSAEPAERF